MTIVRVEGNNSVNKKKTIISIIIVIICQRIVEENCSSNNAAIDIPIVERNAGNRFFNISFIDIEI